MSGFGESDGGDNDIGDDKESQHGGKKDEWNFEHLVGRVPVVHSGYGMSARCRCLLYKMLDSPSAIKAITISANSA